MPTHPTSVIDPTARIAASATIGPFCVIGAEVEIGEATELISHVNVQGPTKIGARNRIFPFSAIGFEPQDYTFKGQRVSLEISPASAGMAGLLLLRG